MDFRKIEWFEFFFIVYYIIGSISYIIGKYYIIVWFCYIIGKYYIIGTIQLLPSQLPASTQLALSVHNHNQWCM